VSDKTKGHLDGLGCLLGGAAVILSICLGVGGCTLLVSKANLIDRTNVPSSPIEITQEEEK